MFTRFRSLRTRLTVLYAGLFAAAMLLISLAVYTAISDNAIRVVRGELAAILALGGGGTNNKGAGDTDALSVQMKMVAGTGFEPVTFRL